MSKIYHYRMPKVFLRFMCIETSPLTRRWHTVLWSSRHQHSKIDCTCKIPSKPYCTTIWLRNSSLKDAMKDNLNWRHHIQWRKWFKPFIRPCDAWYEMKRCEGVYRNMHKAVPSFADIFYAPCTGLLALNGHYEENLLAIAHPSQCYEAWKAWKEWRMLNFSPYFFD